MTRKSIGSCVSNWLPNVGKRLAGTPSMSEPARCRDDDTEALILADILEHHGQMARYIDAGLTGAHFYHGLHIDLWRAIERLETQGIDVDAPHLKSELTGKRKWDAGAARYVYTTLPGLWVPRQTPGNITASVRRLDQVRRCRLVTAELQALHQQPSRVDDPDLATRVGTLLGPKSEPAVVFAPAWPAPLGDAAYYGLCGDLVRRLEPHTESDPAALLLQVIVAFGNVMGRHAYFPVEADRHYLNLYGLLVGETSRGRKGTSWGHVRRLFRSVDEVWASDHLVDGLSSGEGLIWHLRDPLDGERETADPGTVDKRMLVTETEFAKPLRVIGREGNTLSAVIRQAWDTGDLRVLTKHSPAKATGAHLSVLGHITAQELKRYLTVTEAGNGFGNRFLIACVRRSKLLPEGGRLHQEDFASLVTRLRDAVDRVRDGGELRRDDDARQLWAATYPTLTADRPGLYGAMTGRAEAQVTRLSCLVALADMSSVVRVEHLRAALELWRYCQESARYLFGDALGDSVADQLRAAVRRAGPQGLTRSEVLRGVFSKNRSAAELEAAMQRLEGYGLARREIDGSGSTRPIERWFATDGTPADDIDDVNDIAPATSERNVVNVVGTRGPGRRDS